MSFMMEGQNAFLVLLLQGMICSVSFAGAEESRSANFITRENKRLKGHVVERFESLSFLSCSQSCLKNAWCTSTNFKESSKKSGKGTCELNKHEISVINENTKFHEQQGVIFSMLFKGCFLTRCLNGGSCLFDEKKQTFSCLCTPGWTGEKCQIDINECSSTPCRNGGTCNDHINGYSCACVLGFDGRQCENIDVCHGYQNLTSADRKNTYVSNEPYLCDYNLNGWYRFQGDAGTRMATTCPPQYRCGVNDSYWLDSPHPTVADGETTTSVCAHSNGDCCNYRQQIKVKNCGSYYVYYFYPSSGCPYRYCGSD